MGWASGVGNLLQPDLKLVCQQQHSLRHLCLGRKLRAAQTVSQDFGQAVPLTEPSGVHAPNVAVTLSAPPRPWH